MFSHYSVVGRLTGWSVNWLVGWLGWDIGIFILFLLSFSSRKKKETTLPGWIYQLARVESS